MTEQNSDTGAGDQGQQQQQQQQQQGDAPWYAALPDDLKGDAKVTRYAKSEDAARALIHFQGLYGVPENQLLRLPKPDDAAGNEALWNRMGRPESADKYELEVPDGSPLDKDATSAFLAHMHKAGPFTGPMAKAAMDWYAGYAKQVGEQVGQADAQARTGAEASLKAEWGDAYKQNLDAAAQAAIRFGGEDYKKYLDESGMGNDPRSMKAWLKVAEAGREAGPPPKDPGRDQAGGLMTPASARAELAKMEGDKVIMAALHNANDAQHEFYTSRRLQLIGMANAAG